jgi:hypothetical protein
VIGTSPISLSELAARELLDITPDREVAAQVDEITNPPGLLETKWGTTPTIVERALSSLEAEKRAEIERQEQQERECKKAERQARKAAQRG